MWEPYGMEKLVIGAYIGEKIIKTRNYNYGRMGKRKESICGRGRVFPCFFEGIGGRHNYFSMGFRIIWEGFFDCFFQKMALERVDNFWVIYYVGKEM